jgi:hypothetical protein
VPIIPRFVTPILPGKRKTEMHVKGFDKTSRALIWLLVAFTATATLAVVQAMHEGWNIGDTIGLGFFTVLAALSIYEALRRRRRKSTTE